MLSPSVSIRATSTPSWDVPLIRPIAVAGCTGPLRFPSDPRPVTPRPPVRRPSPRAPTSEHLQVRIPAYSGKPGFHPPDLRARGPRHARAQRQDHRLYRVRLHRALTARGIAAADHDALLDAADWSPPDRADGRRDHARWRPIGQRREPQDPDRRGYQPESRRHP